MSDEVLWLTDEQSAMLALAASGTAIVTSRGSPNDIVWNRLSQGGLMEPASYPAVFEGSPLVAWKLTPEGLEKFSGHEAPPISNT